MQYLLTEEEYKRLTKNYDKEFTDTLLQNLRTKILELAKFKCFHDLPEEEYNDSRIEDGYCDGCPLSFCENKDKKCSFSMCPHENRLFSK